MPHERVARSRTTVLLVDDEPIYVEALELVLAADEHVEVVGRAADGAEAVERALALRPDVVLMDLHLPGVDGIEATSRLVRLLPDVAVVMLSSSGEPEDVLRSYRAGALAYLTKEADAARLVDTILGLAGGTPPAPGGAGAVSTLLRRALGGRPELLPAPVVTRARP